MTDQWTRQGTGVVVELGFECGFCYCTAGVTEGYAVKVGTHATDQVPITVSAGVGDALAIALKTGSAGDYVPAMFQGIIKMDTTSNVTLGTYVMGASGGATVLGVGTGFSTNGVLFGGASYVLGRALQTATSGDEILIYVNPI